MNFLSKIDSSNIPKHVAIIMDGNGRWAKKQGHERLFGHSFGVDSVREVVKAAIQLGVRHLTLYAFSTENWARPKEEVDGLMQLMVRTIASEVDELHSNGVRLMSMGDTEGLPLDCQQELSDAAKRMEHNTKLDLILALNYSARWELTNAVKNIALQVEKGMLKPSEIDDQLISKFLCTKGIPDPELLIRTSGEQRLSNFLLWQCAYTEFYFTDILWPDFKEENFYEAVLNYQERERRFGQVSEQLI